MAASATRVYGKDLSVVSIGGQVLTTIVKSVDINEDPDTIEGTTLGDTSKFNQTNHPTFRHSITIAYDMALASAIAAVIALKGTGGNAFSIVQKSGGLSWPTSGGQKCYVENVRANVQDGGQTLTIDITSDGT